MSPRAALPPQAPTERAAPASPRSRAPASRPITETSRPRKRSHTGKIRVLMTPEQLLALPLDHKAGFILSMLATVSTLDELLDISGMPRNDAMRLLCDLADLGAIDLG